MVVARHTRSRQNFTGGTRRRVFSAASRDLGRARAGNDGEREEKEQKEELYIRRQKQRSALNLARTGSDYASQDVK